MEGIATITFDEPNSPVNTMCLQWQDDLHATWPRRCCKTKDAIHRHSAGVGQEHLLCRRRPQRHHAPDAQLTPAPCYAEIERVKQDFPHAGNPGQTGGQPARTAPPWAAAGRWRWWATTASPSMTARSSLACPRSRSGLLPGASGVTKMTRHLGLMGAQPYLVEGQLFTPSEAKGLGLVHDAGGAGRRTRSRDEGQGPGLDCAPTPPPSTRGRPRATRCPAALPGQPDGGRACCRWRRPCSRRRPVAATRARGHHWPAWSRACRWTCDTALRIESRYLARAA